MSIPHDVIHQQVDVAIIGGGVAGLTAALELIEKAKADGARVPSIAIIEASDRTGGRVKTIEHEGRTINVGAQWFHGGEANPFWQFIQNRYPDLKHSVDTVENRVAVTQTGLKGTEFREEAFAAFDTAWSNFKAENPGQDISLAQLQKTIGTDDSKNFAEFMASCWMGAPNAAAVSCTDFFNDPFGPGGIQVKGGNQQIIDRLTADLKAAGVEFRLNTPVDEVRRSNNGVLLTDMFGSIHPARQTIVTTPVNVLQKKLLKFEPQLSMQIRDAIDGIQSSHFTKIVVPVNEDFFKNNNIVKDTHIDIPAKSPPVFAHVYSNGTPAVTLMVGGDLAKRMELADASEIQKYITDTFKAVPAFKGIENAIEGKPFVSNWSMDPWAGAAYSAAKPGHERKGSMGDGPITFAGEAWCRSDQGGGTMAGAYASAQEAANRAHLNLNPALAHRVAPVAKLAT